MQWRRLKRWSVPRARSFTNLLKKCGTQAVELLYKANGGASVYSGNPLERRLRDIQAAGQHTVVSMKTWEAAGRVLLGLDPQHGVLF